MSGSGVVASPNYPENYNVQEVSCWLLHSEEDLVRTLRSNPKLYYSKWNIKLQIYIIIIFPMLCQKKRKQIRNEV